MFLGISYSNKLRVNTGPSIGPSVFSHLSLPAQDWTQLNLTSRALVPLCVWTPAMPPLWTSFTLMDFLLTPNLVQITVDMKEVKVGSIRSGSSLCFLKF